MSIWDENIQKPGFSASNKHCQANIRLNFGKFNSSHTKNLVSWLRQVSLVRAGDT
jgi:hypothetical protein